MWNLPEEQQQKNKTSFHLAEKKTRFTPLTNAFFGFPSSVFPFFLRNLRPCFYQVGVCVCVCVCVCVMFSQSVALFSTALFRLSRSASRTPIRIRGHPSPLHSTGVHHLLFAPPFSSPSLRFAPSACRGLLLRSSVRPAGRPVFDCQKRITSPPPTYPPPTSHLLLLPLPPSIIPPSQ